MVLLESARLMRPWSAVSIAMMSAVVMMVTAMPRWMASRWMVEVASAMRMSEGGGGGGAEGALVLAGGVDELGDECEERAGEEFVGAGVGAVVGVVGVGGAQ